jgi:hypothetical protein
VIESDAGSNVVAAENGGDREQQRDPDPTGNRLLDQRQVSPT